MTESVKERMVDCRLSAEGTRPERWTNRYSEAERADFAYTVHHLLGLRVWLPDECAQESLLVFPCYITYTNVTAPYPNRREGNGPQGRIPNESQNDRWT